MITALGVLSFSSCKKDSSSGAVDQTSVNLADDDAVTDVVYEDVFNTADNATIILDQMGKSIDAKSETVLSDSCPAITITRPTAVLWPKIVTVDYGTSCTGINDNIRSGKIVIEVTGPRLAVWIKKNYYICKLLLQWNKS